MPDDTGTVGGGPRRCTRPGCSGTIDTDGYCTECGHLADAPVPTNTEPATTAVTRHLSRLGLDLVDLPPVPRRDPRDACLSNPVVPEGRRFCSKGHPTGSEIEGKCSECSSAFRFRPKLEPGDVVAGQYEVAGCLAYGGLGWVYLVQNRHVEDLWEVLKGLRHGEDAEAVRVAIDERRFLAQVKHEKIVQIHNFVEHDGDGYIVMEYVAGTTLRELARDKPLALDRAIAYVLQALEAIGHLHHEGLLYCDLKPENLIAIDRSVKLIDLGAVHRIGDANTAVYGTKGFKAPELEDSAPSIASDLYTVGRTLALLTIEVPDYQGDHEYELPERDAVALFRDSDAYFRFQVKATAHAPERRFQSAEDMAAQLLGVLHEVSTVAVERRPAFVSSVFAPPDRVHGIALDWRSLPTVLSRDETEDQTGLELRVARALIETHQWPEVAITLDGLEAAVALDWRVSWYRGLASLAQEDVAAARASFDAVYSDVPGELVPKVALALAAEQLGDVDGARRFYDVVSRAEPRVGAAAFGLARCELAAGRSERALAAYDRVPPGSSAYADARVAHARLLTAETFDPPPTVKELSDAASELDGIALSDFVRADVTVELLRAVFGLLTTGTAEPDPSTTIFGHPVTELDLRRGLDESYRALANLAMRWQERVRLVDLANEIRPWSWT